ncbi:putative hydro-lyase [Mycolicibacterium sp. 120270]|uniref:putative hydro-lyase n=1 Tax=Mycolicibacterium sp. 120270 TaxID=3090600 RepID=UPI00299D9218|nr:putative hydro-lyase [Mycolicibacterium sp. 120270]MDX1884351.1 putative hydro-lyase [Mycolicibacterium sp. 120270]
MGGHTPLLRDAAASELADACARIRIGEHTGLTSGLASGFAQANLVVLPVDHALDFLRFCVRNPKPCPVLAVTDTGSPYPTTLSRLADLRTDIPRYRVFIDGRLVDEPTDVTGYWRDDLVSFLLGCSFTFEWALASAGLPLAHQRQGVNVAMYVTDRQCTAAGPFAGPLVVSMRPFAPKHIASAVEISSRFPAMHGAPVHIGDPAAIGIADLGAPDFGDPVALEAGDVPVFWACGVTPQVAVVEAEASLAIFHAPGRMFITDRPHAEFDSQEALDDRA